VDADMEAMEDVMEVMEDVVDPDMEVGEGMEGLVTTDDLEDLENTIITEDMMTFAPMETPKGGSTWELLTKQKLT